MAKSFRITRRQREDRKNYFLAALMIIPCILVVAAIVYSAMNPHSGVAEVTGALLQASPFAVK